MDGIDIRPMKKGDVQAVVQVHLEAFQNFFLSFLGRRFLQELYLGILEDFSGMAFISLDGGIITGFVAGTTQPDGFYGRLLKQRWWRFGLAAVSPALRRPVIIPRLLRAFERPEEARGDPGCGTLMSIAVLPGTQKRGAGQKLVSAFLQEANRRGLRAVNLTTDEENNEKVNLFYQKLGFRRTRSFQTPEGRRMFEYTILLEDPQGVTSG